ncbi:LysR family transcriptional regulator [Magnetospirillum sp. 15-1]|uniref:winged helix-turn-helix domain-containing protein n=1 Tax=Magnetospirillum sp. 15-1 TaxID=1979370 RepID=UPI000BBC47F0|nr:LysR family transcriptional regulator [Magnetospirillum sp. 15-1]
MSETGFRIQLRILPFIGPGKMLLLDGIERHGSISAAARALNMSYARAWRLIETMNRRFKSPLVSKAPGGQGGGGAHLTEAGRTVLEVYRSMEERVHTLFATDMEILERMLLPLEEQTPAAGPQRSDFRG